MEINPNDSRLINFYTANLSTRILSLKFEKDPVTIRAVIADDRQYDEPSTYFALQKNICNFGTVIFPKGTPVTLESRIRISPEPTFSLSMAPNAKCDFNTDYEKTYTKKSTLRAISCPPTKSKKPSPTIQAELINLGESPRTELINLNESTDERPSKRIRLESEPGATEV